MMLNQIGGPPRDRNTRRRENSSVRFDGKSTRSFGRSGRHPKRRQVKSYEGSPGGTSSPLQTGGRGGVGASVDGWTRAEYHYYYSEHHTRYCVHYWIRGWMEKWLSFVNGITKPTDDQVPALQPKICRLEQPISQPCVWPPV